MHGYLAWEGERMLGESLPALAEAVFPPPPDLLAWVALIGLLNAVLWLRRSGGRHGRGRARGSRLGGRRT